VSDDNKGIFVQVDDGSQARDEGWVLIDWHDFREVRFEH
jgi:hypothetical protein